MPPPRLTTLSRSAASDHTRTRILDAAAEVFAAQGFHGATVRDVAVAAGTSDGTIYNHVGSKDALLLGLLERLSARDRRPDDFAEAAGTPLPDFLPRYLARRLRELEPGLDTLRAVLPEVLARPELRAAFAEGTLEPSFALAEGYLADRVDAGELDGDPALLARLLAGAVLGLVLLRLLDEPVVAARWSELAPLLGEITAAGLAPEDG